MPKILVATDSFKSTATADQATASIAAGVRAALTEASNNAESGATSEVSVQAMPLADGGEGTSAILAAAAGRAGNTVERITLPTTNARGRLTEATYYLNHDEHVAYIDTAAATGLAEVADSPDPLHGDSYGTGVLIADAESKGAQHTVLGLGGTATIDGGSGILAALGAPAHDARGYALPKGGAPLVNLTAFDTAQLNVKAAGLSYTLLADTSYPPQEAAAVYGPQKGASREDVALLTGALLRLCEVTGIAADSEYFGAAGAVPVGITHLSELLYGSRDNVVVEPGGIFIAEKVSLAEKIAAADVVITGEGAFDAQSLTGKTVGTVAEIARREGTNIAIVAGRFDAPADSVATWVQTLPSPADAGTTANFKTRTTQQLRAAGYALGRRIAKDL